MQREAPYAVIEESLLEKQVHICLRFIHSWLDGDLEMGTLHTAKLG